MSLSVVQRGPARSSRIAVSVALIAIGLTVAAGTLLRLADPLSSDVVPAEDPYNHMALTQEHLRTGELRPLYEGQALYPPGLHGFMAAAVVLTGADLYELTRLAPSVLGAIGIIGMAALLWRTAGPVAAFVGALAVAVSPEAIFRSTMLSPTALDLALIPAFLYALLRLVEGRLAWAWVAAPTALFLALAHPWLVAIFGAAFAVFLLGSMAFGWQESQTHRMHLMGVALCMAVLGVALGVALTMPTFGFLLPLPDGVNLVSVGLVVAVLALAPAAGVAWARRRGWARQTVRMGHPPMLIRLAISLAIAAALLATISLAVRQGMPDLVDLPRMIGWPILVLAVAGLVALPFIPSPIANLAAALAVVMLPFVLFNPLDSEFLSHRTVVFLGVALALLAGCLAGATARVAGRLIAGSGHSVAPAGRSTGRALYVAALPALVVGVLLGGSVYAATPDGYEGGWYRLYNECEMDAFRSIAAVGDAEPQMLIITGDWQAKLVLAALTEDASRVGYIAEVFSDERRRDDLVAQMEHEGRPLMLVTDRYLRVETPDAELGFLASPPWQPAGAWCANMGLAEPRVLSYVLVVQDD